MSDPLRPIWAPRVVERRARGQLSFASPEERNVKMLRLSDVERELIRRDYSNLRFPTSADREPDDITRFLADALRWFLLSAPRWVTDEILRWRLDQRRKGILVIDNFPVDPDLPPTPTEGGRAHEKTNTISEMVLGAVATLLGDTVAFAAEREGEIIQDLTPVKGKEENLTNEGTVGLGWHNEHAVTGYSFDVPAVVISHLAFFALREDPAKQGKTAVADVNAALAKLTPEQRAELRKPIFKMKPPYLVRQELPEHLRERSGLSVLTGPEVSPQVQVALYGDMVTSETDVGEEAVIALQHALDDVRFEADAVPGRVVIVDNRLALHARMGFQPRFDGTDRWLQRIMVTQSHWQFRAWHTEIPHIVDPATAH